jgi:hypothetical protein
MPLLWTGISLLLAVSVRVSYLSGVYGRKHLGDVLQCHHLAVPGLWGPKWFWESINQLIADSSWLIGWVKRKKPKV